MKLNILIILIFVAISKGYSQSPCVTDPLYADSTFGIWPDTSQFFLVGNSEDCDRIFNIKTKVDTCINDTMCLYIKGMRIDTIVGLPEDFIYTSSYYPGNYWVNLGNAPNNYPVQGCFRIQAPQAAVSAALDGQQYVLYPFNIKIDLLVKNSNPASPLFQDYEWLSTQGILLNYNYVLRIVDMWDPNIIGIDELNPNTFSAGQSFPNPSIGQITIPFNTTKDETVTLKIHNQLGMLVHHSSMHATTGSNRFIFNINSFASGLYSYTLNNGKQILNGKMLVE